MNIKLFVNIPVKDLNAAKAFFSGLGFSFNPQFTNDDAACLVLGNDNYFMLLKEEFFKGFMKKQITDSGKYAEAIFSIMLDSRAKVDELADKAMAAGAKTSMPPMEMDGMYGRSFEDLDGHLWEVGYMDPAMVK